MKRINWIQAVPAEYCNKSFGLWYINYKIGNGDRVSKGDVLATCVCKSPLDLEFSIYAASNGYFYSSRWVEDFFDHIQYSEVIKNEYLLDKYVVGELYDSVEEICEVRYGFTYEITIDDITGSKIIDFDSYGISKYSIDSEYYHYGSSESQINLGLKDNLPNLSFVYNKKLKIKKGDKLYFCESEKPYLELEVLKSPCPYKYNDKMMIDIRLMRDDIDALINNSFRKIVIVYKDGRPRESIYNAWSLEKGCYGEKPIESSDKTFNRYVHTYKTALIEAGISFGNEKTQPFETLSVDPCFVYLMYDRKNGYYKIGMSKTPVYREKTLQSEKPSIEMLCAKEYPSRKIAEAIERALHKVYEEERIRGEWFNLSESDVIMIQRTLQ